MHVSNTIVRMAPYQLMSGMILAVDVYSVYGEVVIRANTVINSTVINRIMISGTNAVYVFSRPNEEKIEKVVQSDITVRQVQIATELNSVLATQQVSSDSINQIIDDAIDVANDTGGVGKYLKLLQRKTEYTYTHCLSVGIMSNHFAGWVKMTESDMDDFTLASSLHDIGKLSVDIDILHKPDRLTSLEFKEMKKHVLNGCRLLANCDVPERVKTAVSEHHERMDGGGYPYKKRGHEISEMGNMLSIVDVYDALVSKRSYREAMCPFDALEIMMKEKHHAFNFKLLDNFIQYIVYAFMGAGVKLSDDREGEIVFINPNAMIKPFVRVDGGEIINLLNHPEIRITKVFE